MRELLGGKGANLAEMTRVLGGGRVPAGFTVTTEACVAYMNGDGELPEGLEDEVSAALERLEQLAGKRLGDPEDPLLVSVRSGARESMPGMLDTVLNLGLNDSSVEGLAERTGDPRFAWDSYRRLLQMFADVVSGLGGEQFENALADARDASGADDDAGLAADDLRRLCDRFKATIAAADPEGFPQDPRGQLRRAIVAVFESWNGERAVAYRRIAGIPDDWGTAVNVQQMVFGNKGPTSGSGVAFSRDEITGAPEPSGDFLANAQGEDVVAGTRNPEELEGLAQRMPEAHAELLEVLTTLERHFGDMQDVEFTVEEGRLYMLQARSAKRPAQAAVRFACDAVDEGLLDRSEALRTLDAAALEALLHPSFDPSESVEELARGIAASPGAAKGAIVFSAADAVRRGAAGEDVILVRRFTQAEDVAGFHAARGILTSEGGKSSHAALVARGMGRPCVCGAATLDVDAEHEVVRVDGRELHAGERIAIDGSSGVVTLTDVNLIRPEITDEFARVLGWADEVRRLGVRTNAESGDDAARARMFGAEGIGLCRTEHMFFGSDRDSLVREMFLAAELWRRGAEGAEEEFTRALDRLAELQRADFAAIFRAMAGLPVTIRLFDPPLHEFLPLDYFEAELERHRDTDLAELAQLRVGVARELQEVNPMLGLRGVRLAVLFPALFAMQVRAVIAAGIEVAAEGEPPMIEIMLPLVAYETEFDQIRAQVAAAAEEAMLEAGDRIAYSVGTMIELPRACLIAGELAPRADFFSFGTNDLTQTTAGFSRDDAEKSVLPEYQLRRLIDRSPFETIDVPGVGELIEIAVERGRAANPELHLGICGEHGGDPDSIRFFERIGLDYVSCSPFRVPIARIAAAQAVLGE